MDAAITYVTLAAIPLSIAVWVGIIHRYEL